jgi:hypothetical protein
MVRIDMIQEAKKKTAKKAVAKSNGAPERERQIISLLVTHHSPIVTALMRRYAKMSYKQVRPSNIDDIDTLVKTFEGYPFLKLESMKGFCKIWDAVVDNWDHLLKLRELNDRKAIKQHLNELASPYLLNSITHDYSKSLYSDE